MKDLLCSFKGMLAFIALVSGISFPVFSQETLNFLTWEDYIDPEVIEAFETETGIDVVEHFFDSDDQRDAILEKSKGRGYDMILVSGLQVEPYIRNGWLDVLPANMKATMATMDKRLLGAFPAAEWYSIPYFWGTLGIAYRADLVDKPITSWMEFFKPGKDLQGKIAVLESTAEAVGSALKATGYSINNRSSNGFEEALQLLESQAEHVAEYGLVDFSDENSPLVTGEIVAAMLFSGDALMAQELNENITYVLPKEGSQVWIDYVAVSKFSQSRPAAWKFVEFINRPEIAAQNANYVYYAPPSKAIYELLDDEFKADETIFPKDSALKNSEFSRPMLPRYMDMLDARYQVLVARKMGTTLATN